MNENAWIVLIVVAICSYLAVKAWVNARRAEREAFYRSEAIKKIAEGPGNIPESMLQVIKDALTPAVEPPSNFHSYDYNREREAYYKYDTLKKVAEMGAGAGAVLEYLREDEKKKARRRGQGIRLGGLITAAAGIGTTILLSQLVPERPVYLAGLIPTLVGLVLLGYSFTVAPKE